MVTIYTTKTCPSCVMVKRFFQTKNVNYQEIDITEDPAKQQEAFELSGALTVPVTIINSQVVIGYNPSQLSVV